MELTLGQLGTLSPEVRGYQMLSVMRAVMMMPNATVFSHLRSSDHEEFNSLLLGELEAEVHPVQVSECQATLAQTLTGTNRDSYSPTKGTRP
ncbi:hypothetical protein BDM02DRAFT_3192199 [Thelephora ganbajun]|uniref:Uncharacterized protein n=1 Tax=Thelephora ganbajun TaxID=370292 RepID=A0ACB6Z139_THEGA|nr:hypothetical protein BDM02DRAFT_3192199 [Thelephora ganbajun]